MATATYSGPVDYAVFAVPYDAPLSEALHTLLARIDLGAIELLDLEVVERGSDGEAVRKPLSTLNTEGFATVDSFDLSIFENVDSEALDAEDLALIVAELPNEHRAIVVVYEDRSLASFADRIAAAGGQLLWSGGIDLADAGADTGSDS